MRREAEPPERNAAAGSELRAVKESYFQPPFPVSPRPAWRSQPPPLPACQFRPPFPGTPSSTAPWTLAPPPCQVTFPLVKFEGRIVYCRTTKEVEQATVELLHKVNITRTNMDSIPLGFDIEWRPVFKKGEQRKAAVMQICVDNMTCYVMHIIHSGIPWNLKSLLEDKSYTKVGMNIADDARKMFQDYNVRVDPLVDLSKLANLKLYGVSKQWGLASLTERLTCKKLLKPHKIRMGNWEKVVLSDKELQYAATDAYVSWYLYELLRNMPDAKGDNGHEEKETSNVPKKRKKHKKLNSLYGA